jgi:sulfur carrier protein ThiS
MRRAEVAIQVKVRGQAARFFPEGKDSFTLPWQEAMTVQQLLQSLGVASELVVAVVNGQRAQLDHCLQDGDSVMFFSPMAGG